MVRKNHVKIILPIFGFCLLCLLAYATRSNDSECSNEDNHVQVAEGETTQEKQTIIATPTTDRIKIIIVPQIPKNETVSSSEKDPKNAENHFELGEKLSDIRMRYSLNGGEEIDLAAVDLNWDDWLFAFADEEGILLLHTADDYDSTELMIGSYALYDTDGDLIEWNGSTPVSIESVIFFMNSSESEDFIQYIGFWGENYDEDTYVYFLDQCGFFLYNTVDKTCRIQLISNQMGVKGAV